MQLNEVKNVSELWEFVSTDTPVGDDIDASIYEVASKSILKLNL